MRRSIWFGAVLVCALGCGKVPARSDDAEADGALGAADGGPDERSIDIDRPVPIVGVHVGTGVHRSPRLVGDRLYFVAEEAGGTGVFVAERRDGAFGEPAPVAAEGWDGRAVHAIALSADEREIVVEAIDDDDGEHDLYRAVRDAVDGPFGPLVRLAVSLPHAVDAAPALAGDELFFVSSRGGAGRLYRAARDGREGELGEAVLVDVDGVAIDATDPWLAADGHTLYYGKDRGGGTSAIYRAVRTGASPASFGDETELETLTLLGAQTGGAVLAEDLIVFASNRPWSPASLALWSARVCRGAECPSPAKVPCPGQSPDGQRCYVLVSGTLPWAGAHEACAQQGMHLASIHSRAELDWLLAMAKGVPRLWTGGNDLAGECNKTVPGCHFAWDAGEPFLYAPWFDAANPDDVGADEDCIELVTDAYVRETPFVPGLNDVGCAQAKPFLCER